MSALTVLQASAPLFCSLMVWSVSLSAGELGAAPAARSWQQTQHDRLSNRAETPAATSPINPQRQLLARVIPPAVTNAPGIGAADLSATLSGEFGQRELLFLLSSRLQPKQDNGELELQLKLLMPPWKPISTTAGPIDLRILDKPMSGLSSQFSVRFDVLCGEKSLGTYFANVQARLFHDIWVTPTPVRRGASLSEVDLQKEQRDVISFREPVWSPENLPASMRLSDFRFAETVPAGGMILARHVQARPVMFRGQQVMAVIQNEVMSVSAKVEVLEEGAPGQYVRARNLRTRKEIRGKVIDEDTIEVSF
ncbi:MAG: flagellar basal body P-ring formation protein FlgA [Verrucomicrobia bacterium]|nr:flagellar basal body P-ring formation protein FlgA [Verrucomicrobiota bacterium]